MKNISDVLSFVGSQDARAVPIKLPIGFNEWSEAKTQLEADNPEFFATADPIPADAEISALWTEHGKRGFMLIQHHPKRYICTNWLKNLVQRPVEAPIPNLMRHQMRQAFKSKK
jgi:hypothetical protein